MRRILSNRNLWLFLSVPMAVATLLSSVPELWGISVVALIAAVVVLGWRLAPPVLAWLIAINMLAIWADIATIELNNSGWAAAFLLPGLPDAIIASSCAMVFLAIGMRCGLLLGRPVFAYRLDAAPSQTANAVPYSALRITVAYIAVQPVTAVIGLIGKAVPGLAQPAYAFGLLKFTLIYMLAAKVFATGRNFYLLTGVVAAEIVIGSTGGWAGYKEGFFVVVIALAASSRRFTLRRTTFALAGVAAMIYLSLAWTAVKQEYRADIASRGTVASLLWLADKYFGGEIDFASAAVALLERVGYTKFYALVMNANTEGREGSYRRAVLHIITPRLLFPDKAALDDSAQTEKILGWSIAEGTSIGLGYVAQGYIDFGFPGLLVPIVGLGAIVGTIYTYFLTRPAPPLIREAFAVACLFNALRFETDIEKQFGGLIMGFLMLGFALRYGAAILHRRLELRGHPLPRKSWPPEIAVRELESQNGH